MLWFILTVITSAASVLLFAPLVSRFEARRSASAEGRAAVPAPSLAGAGLLALIGLFAGFGGIDMNLSARSADGDAKDAIERLAALQGMPSSPNATPPKTERREPVPASAATGAKSSPAVVKPGQSATNLPSVDEMIERLEVRLRQNPKDADGWRMLGWSLSGTDRFAEAANAYARAIEIEPKRLDYRVARLDALFKSAGGRVDSNMTAAADDILKLDPANGHARHYRALAKAQSGDVGAAAAEWREILGGIGKDDPLAAEIRQRLNATTGKEPSVAANAASPSPAATAVPSSPDSRLPAEPSAAQADTAAMIASMVDGLAARLAASPRDVDGWIKLIRSHAVLGEQAKARDAVRRALDVFQESANERQMIRAAARQFQLDE